MTTVLVVRHGETAWNRDGRLQGWAPTRLTDRGRRQAEAVGRLLARDHDVDRIHVSDLRRTRETADRIGAHVDAPTTFDRAWRERDFGVYQGLASEEAFSRFPELSLQANPDRAVEVTPDSGESLEHLRERVLAGWSDFLAAADADETHLLVAHGGPIYVLLGRAKGVGLGRAVLDHTQDNCALTEFEHDPASGATRVVRENATDWDV